MLMGNNELDAMMKHYLTANVYTSMCEVLDSIRAKVERRTQSSSIAIE